MEASQEKGTESGGDSLKARAKELPSSSLPSGDLQECGNPEGGTSWVDDAQNELFNGWQRWASFACIWAWSCITSKLAFDNSLLQSLAGVFAAPNEVTLCAVAGTLLIVLAAASRLRTIVGSKRLALLSGTLLTLGSILYGAGVLCSLTPLFVSGMVGGGASIALLKIAYGEMYSRMSLRQGLVSMGYAIIFSTVFVLLLLGLSQLMLSLALLVVALPCAPLLFAGTKRLLASDHGAPLEPGNPSSLPERQVRFSSCLPERQVRFSVSLLLLPALVSFSFGIVKGMMPWIDISELGSIDAAFRYAELLVGIALVISSYLLGVRFGAAQIYALALMFVVAGLVFFSAHSVPRQVSFFIHEVGFALFYFFMIVYWGNLSRRTGMSTVLVYTIGYGTFQAAQIAGSLLGFYVVGNPELNFALLVLLCVVFAFFVVVLLLFSTSRSSLRQWLIADGSDARELGDEIPIAVAALCSEHRLSPREHEVLGLIARGRNASYVARALYIAPDTAKTHIKSIYRKLGVHTQQDLIDLIDKTVHTPD